MWKTQTHKILFGVASLAVGTFLLSLVPGQAHASTGTNQEISFEGKVVTAAGINIPDGTYNMEFKIYSGGTNTGGGTLDWTEDWLVSAGQGVTFTSGTFQVNLGSINPFGSSVNWNSYPLYLSLQIGNTSSCTPAGNFQANCGGDGEMTPYILFTSTPYAFNSNELGGIAAGGFVQLSPASQQTGNINISGNVTAGGTYNTNTFTANSLQFGGASTATLQSASSQALNITANAASTWSTSAGSLTIQAAGTNSLSLDTGAAGIVSVAGSNATTLTLGNGGATVSINSGSSLNIGNNAVNKTINIGATGTAAYTTTVNIGTSTGAAQSVTIGSTNSNSPVVINSGTSGTTINLSGSGSNPGLVLKPVNNTTEVFQVQNAANASIVNVDTTTNKLAISGPLNLVQVLSPSSAPTVAVNATAGNLNGTYYYTTTFVTASGETDYGTVSASVSPVNQEVNLTNIPTGPAGLVVARKIYRTTGSGSVWGPFYYVTTINDNSTTSYTDDTGDGSLGSSVAPVDNNTASIQFNGSSVLRVGGNGQNTWIGKNVGTTNTTGAGDLGIGANALSSNTTGNDNLAIGYSALGANTSGGGNLAVGAYALSSNTTGSSNIAYGYGALGRNSTGGNNFGLGTNALGANTTGSDNTASGSNSLDSNTSGSNNTAFGYQALATNTTGTYDASFGYGADVLSNNLTNATSIGYNAKVGSSNSIILGSSGTNVGIGTSYAPNLLTAATSTSSSGTITQNSGSNTVTGSGTSFSSSMVGGTLYYNNGTTGTITAVSSSTSLTSSNATGGWSGATYIIVYGGFNITGSATVYLQPTSDSTTAFKIQNAANTTTVLDADTVNGRIGIDTAAPGYALDVNGNINTNTGFLLNGSSINSAGVLTNVAYLNQTQTFTQANTFSASGTALTVDNNATIDGQLNLVDGAYIQDFYGSTWINLPTTGAGSGIGTGGAGSNPFIAYVPGSGHWFNNASAGDVAYRNTLGRILLGTSNGNANVIINTNGSVLFQNSTDSTTGFQIQNAAGNSNLFVADTTDSIIGIGTTPSTSNADATLQVNNRKNGPQISFGSDTLEDFYGTAALSYNSYYANVGGSGYVDNGGGAADSLLLNNNGLALDTVASGSSGAILTPNSVFAVGINGNVLFQNSTDSSTAFQVQDTSADGSKSLFTVDTTNNLVQVGSATSSATQINLALDQYNSFSDVGTCGSSASSPNGALYYNTDTNAIRACINGGWTDLVSTAGLGIVLFGVQPDSGSAPGDLESTSTSGVSGPCKVSWASATSVTIQACTVYSGGRQITQSQVTVTLPSMSTSQFTHLCYWNGSAASGPITNSTSWFTTPSTTETANLPTFSANAPVVCLATIKNSSAAANTIGQIYDTRVFTTSTKQFVEGSVALAPGWITITNTSNTTQVTTTTTAGTEGVAGAVVVGNSSPWLSGGPSAIIATGGPLEVEATGGSTSAYNYIETSTTSGYATTVTTASTTLTLPAPYMGLALTAFGSCSTPSASSCQGSLLTQVQWMD
jgi:hypothetical protein